MFMVEDECTAWGYEFGAEGCHDPSSSNASARAILMPSIM